VSHREQGLCCRSPGKPSNCCASCSPFRSTTGAVPAGRRTGQFAAIPMNIARADSSVDYLNTGVWSKKALGEARRLTGKVNIVADEAASKIHHRAGAGRAQAECARGLRPLHAQRDIGGVEFPYVPRHRGGCRWWPTCPRPSCRVPSRLEVRSHLTRAPRRISVPRVSCGHRHQDLTGKARPVRRRCGDYQGMAMRVRCSTRRRLSAWYCAGLVFRWLKAQGGLAAVGERNRAKAELLYSAIDASVLRQPGRGVMPLMDERARSRSPCPNWMRAFSPRRARRTCQPRGSPLRGAACARASTNAMPLAGRAGPGGFHAGI